MKPNPFIFGAVVAAGIGIVTDFGISDWQWWAAVVLINAAAAFCYSGNV